MCREREKGITTMARDSGQRFIRRNRPPRVHITYEDPYNAERMIELPFVMGVLADLSGNNSAVEKPEMDARKFLDIDMDNFEGRMAAIEPGVSFKVDNKLSEEGGEKLLADPQLMAALQERAAAQKGDDAEPEGEVKA